MLTSGRGLKLCQLGAADLHDLGHLRRQAFGELFELGLHLLEGVAAMDHRSPANRRPAGVHLHVGDIDRQRPGEQQLDDVDDFVGGCSRQQLLAARVLARFVLIAVSTAAAIFCSSGSASSCSV